MCVTDEHALSRCVISCMRTYSGHISVLLHESHMAALAWHLYCIIISSHAICSGDCLQKHVCLHNVSYYLLPRMYYYM